jgi:HSP20 family molecular chaperone IbpA
MSVTFPESVLKTARTSKGNPMPRAARDVMWSEALAILARADRVTLSAFTPTRSGWEPPIDVLETEAGLIVVVALPGVPRDEMDFGVANNELLVRGTRRWPATQGPARVHRIELPHGRFERRLPLPPGAYQLVDGTHSDGCLIINLRRLL